VHPNILSALVEAANSIKSTEPVLASRILEAISALSSHLPVTDLALQDVTQAATHRSTQINLTATYVLSAIAEHDARGMQAVMSLFNSSKSEVRLSALVCLSRDTPRAETSELLQLGLKDRSSRIRLKAAEFIAWLQFRDLLTNVQEALMSETNNSAREVMVWATSRLSECATTQYESNLTTEHQPPA
jgi:hypothetical protein